LQGGEKVAPTVALGAEVGINYKEEDFAARVRALAHRYMEANRNVGKIILAVE
jgi:NADPH:quinone reductase-like Zn-dependent oxidoreductase